MLCKMLFQALILTPNLFPKVLQIQPNAPRLIGQFSLSKCTSEAKIATISNRPFRHQIVPRMDMCSACLRSFGISFLDPSVDYDRPHTCQVRPSFLGDFQSPRQSGWGKGFLPPTPSFNVRPSRPCSLSRHAWGHGGGQPPPTPLLILDSTELRWNKFQTPLSLARLALQSPNMSELVVPHLSFLPTRSSLVVRTGVCCDCSRCSLLCPSCPSFEASQAQPLRRSIWCPANYSVVAEPRPRLRRLRFANDWRFGRVVGEYRLEMLRGSGNGRLGPEKL